MKGKCYKLGIDLNWDLARDACISEDAGDHLWIIDSPEEFNNVIQHFFPGVRTNLGEKISRF